MIWMRRPLYEAHDMKQQCSRALTLLSVITVCAGALMQGCAQKDGDYVAAASFTRNGFALDRRRILQAEDQAIKLWGYVDHHNIYASDAETILEEWWGGNGPSPVQWRFNLKARPTDGAGRSIPVYLPNDEHRDDLLRVFLADARAGRPTKVFLRGRLETFDAPTNVRLHTGVIIKVDSSADISLGEPD